MLKILLIGTVFWFSSALLTCCSTVLGQFVSQTERVKDVCKDILSTKVAFRSVPALEWDRLEVDKTKLTTFYAEWDSACAVFTIVTAKYRVSGEKGDVGEIQRAYQDIQALAKRISEMQLYLNRAISSVEGK